MKSLTFVSAVLALAGAVLAETTSSAKWICFDEPFADGIGKSRFLRTEIGTRAGLTNAVARWWFDDNGALFVDGRRLSGHPRNLDGFSVLDALKTPGRHVVGVEDINLATTGGAILALELAYADGSTEHVHTSPDSWRCSRESPDGWCTPGFDASAWTVPRLVGDAFAAPWSSLVDMHVFLSPAERAAVAAEEVAVQARHRETLARLSREAPPVCRVVYDRGKPLFDIGGVRHSTAFYNLTEDWNGRNRGLLRQIGHLRRAGMHLYGVGVDTRQVWRPDGTIDFAKAEQVLLEALDADPDAHFMFCISTYLPPKWWGAAHPDELVGYANAVVNPHETQVMRNVAVPSFASRAWLRDVADYQRRLVAHLESTPLARRIFAYRTDFGVNHEWHYYGMACDAMPDDGKAMTAAFRRWLRGRYADDVDALRRAWRDPSVTFETARVPPKEVRLATQAAPFRDPAKDRPAVDYARCHAAVVRDCVLNSDRAVKDACRGRALVGNYCGYFFGMHFPAEGWHLANDEILDSPLVDFQSSPYVYGDFIRRAGEPQYARCLLESLRSRGKVALMEADNSTSFSGSPYCSYSRTADEDFAILARDFCQTLCWGCGFWYFDFGQGWYADDAFAPFFARLLPVRDLDADCSSVAEVVVVGDYESVMFTNVKPPFTLGDTVTSRQVRELGHAGAPFDSASFADLAAGRLKDYRVYVFPNLFYATPEKRAVVARLRAAGKTCIWLYAPGYLTPDGASVDGVAALTGFRVRPASARRDGLQPVVEPDDPDAVRTDNYVVKGNDVLCCTGLLSARALRGLFRSRGIFIYSDDAADALYANASFVALHNAKAGPRTIRLPRPSKVTQLYPERRDLGAGQTEIRFDAAGPATTLFRYE